MSRRLAALFSTALVWGAMLAACSDGEPTPVSEPPPAEEAASPAAPGGLSSADRAAARSRGKAIFGVLPEEASSRENPVTAAKIELGRILYFDPRLSKNQDISCNSCHRLDDFGVDGEPTSPGHRGSPYPTLP